MAHGESPQGDPPPAAWSGGPCPACPGTGALVIRRRKADGAIFFHCPACGMAFTHGAAGEPPEYGRGLASVAPGGSRTATEGEIRAAGLGAHARPWRSPPRPPPILRSTRAPRITATGKGGGTAKKALGWSAVLAIVAKVVFYLLTHSSRR